MSPAKLVLPLLLVVGLSACSTPLSPVSEWEDEDPYADELVVDTGVPLPQPDGGPRDGGIVRPDASVRPPDAGLVVDAAVRPPDAAVRDAAVIDASVRDAAVRDAAVRDAATIRDTGVAPDAASLCELRNARECPANEVDAPICPPNTPLRMCAYPVPGSPRELSVYTCTSASQALVNWPTYTRVPCPRNCFGELPSAFEELNYADCKTRPVLPCDALVTDQLAVDFLLHQVATSCGMATYHLGLIFSAEGCPRAIFGQEITDPAIKCIAKRLSSIRFGCAPLCAIAKTVP